MVANHVCFRTKFKLYRIIDLTTIELFGDNLLLIKEFYIVKIRLYEKEDTPAILHLCKETILSVNLKDYTMEQCEIWADSFSNIGKLEGRLGDSLVYVCELDGQLAGFGSLTEAMEIDFLYTHKNFQGKGVGTAILTELEDAARHRNDPELSTEASLTARGFFLSSGYTEVKEQKKIVRGTEFINYIMRKSLTHGK
jgi:putative acetyltransferase